MTCRLEIRVSRDIDNEITLYLTDGLRKIQQRNGLPDSWVSERDKGVLVNLSGGLFIYAATVIRFVGSRELFGPVDQLCAVLALASGDKGTGSVHPLSEIDLFYTLIMRSVPPGILPRIHAILLLIFFPTTIDFWIPVERSQWTNTLWVANTIRLSETQFLNACDSLHSVLELTSSQEIKFYHSSFMDFLQDPSRSGKFCMYSRLDSLRLELLQRLNGVHAGSIGSPGKPIHIDITWPIPEPDNLIFYRLLVDVFFALCQWDGHPLDFLTSEALSNFRFDMIPFLWHDQVFYPHKIYPLSLKRNIHPDFRDRIVQRAYNPVAYLHKPRDALWKYLHVLGCGENRVLCWRGKKYDWHLSPYPTWLKFR
ncbi:hypothetical protein P691DRAFT_762686 [Macrolepiota fuliginosa MF-IS2]|uniref:Uncharacterized protein n=1 Tax=Macrolepiota fuliginosa MF-IS2 TaxID=1400762 RepID=A0A9P5X661_9AGAR|nr:hypothetical protein P691DRAFT_762686 [Macrolepiota fuliginosa MF-IS2]